MAILAASLQNVYQSIDAYLAEHLVAADGAAIALRLHGVRRFVPPPEAPWVEAHYDFLGLEDIFHRDAGLDITSGRILLSRQVTERRGYLQLNGYQRARHFAQRYTTAVLRDAIAQAFPEGGFLPIYNYAQVSEPDIPLEREAMLILDGLTENVVDNGLYSGVIQAVFRIQTRYNEEFSRIEMRT